MIKIKNLTFKYGKRVILDNISCDFENGIFTAIMGPNGSGKTTLLKNMSGILKPQKGLIEIKNKNLANYSLRDFSRISAYVPQKIFNLPSLTVYESVLFGRIPFMTYMEKDIDKKIASDLIKEMGLSDISFKNINEISGGELQKTIIAQAISKEPEILFLDEPLNNLDIKNQHNIMRLLHEMTLKRKMTIIAVLHDLNMAIKFCDKIIFLKNGSICFSGKTDELNSSIINSVFSIECEIIKKGEKVCALY
ncbi:MAG: ABC transporter ATP-binding protein [Elusimicrobiota bacterium]